MRPDSPTRERIALAPTKTYRKVSVLAMAVFAGLTIVGCQQKMGIQPYYQPLEENQMFDDHRASRPLEPGTVSRGDLRADDALFTGKVDGKLVEEFPMTITEEVIARGQNRFNIYCAPCHSKLGDGNGMIVQRGVSRPPSYMEDRLTTSPVGHFYDVITNGYGRMYSYNQQLPVRDRWAIVAYVRALQAAGHGSIEDVPTAMRDSLMQATTTYITTTTMAKNETNMAEASLAKPAVAGGANNE